MQDSALVWIEKHSNICIDQPSVTHLRPSKQRALHPLLVNILYDVNNGGGPNSCSISKASIIQMKISDTLKNRTDRLGNNGHTNSRTRCTTVPPRRRYMDMAGRQRQETKLANNQVTPIKEFLLRTTGNLSKT